MSKLRTSSPVKPSPEEIFSEIKQRVIAARKRGESPEEDDIYNLAVCHMNGQGTPRDTCAAVLLFSSIPEGRLKLDSSAEPKVFIDRGCKNTELKLGSIISVIDSIKDGKRIRNPRSHIIGDLVEVSRDALSVVDLGVIYRKMSEIVDPEKSASCKIIGSVFVSKLFSKELVENHKISIAGYDSKEGFIFSVGKRFEYVGEKDITESVDPIFVEEGGIFKMHLQDIKRSPSVTCKPASAGAALGASAAKLTNLL